ncbi:thiol reductant ABC exporter subunit CydC [Roseibium aggregatum]|uniref:Thiol reductant ABC exporter subunit CydC n=1 Tax=Roseibium aggregatum TaxID=187304 RepID=A0A939EDK9_9HYPH|nr:thiol reductant ABC exporter subunit CydC [Roseibium aggregatum]MBN9670148.1 thiol reductant ABC exporter subunit CydC [Roseibium aggregatum]
MRAVWRVISAQHRYDRLHFWLGIGMALLPAAAGILLLGVSGWFITAAAVAGLTGVFLNIFMPSAIIRGLAIARTAGRYGERVLTHDATFRFLADLRNRLFGAFATRGTYGQRSGTVLNRLTRDVTALDTVYLRLAVPIVVAGVAALCLLAVWASVSAAMFLTGLIFFAAWAALAWTAYARSDRKTARRADAASDAMRLRAADLAAGRRDLAVYGGLEEAAQAILAAGERLTKAEEAEDLRATRLAGISTAIGQLFLAASLAVVVWGAASGHLSPALGVGLVLVVIALPELVAMALPGLAKLPRTALAARRTDGIQSENGARPEVPETADVNPQNASVLIVENVSFRYPGAERTVLEGLGFEVGPGEVVAIAGRSGCGKSTVAALCSRLRRPQDGRILLNGTDIQDIDEDRFRRSVTVLSQRPYLFNETVAENLRLADPRATDDALWTALEHAALSERISRSPDGLQTVLGEGGLGLSGGEQRRLALARAFLTRPALFILDEMTEGLDARTSSDVLSRFFQHKGDKAVLMIAHKKLELEVANRIIMMAKG